MLGDGTIEIAGELFSAGGMIVLRGLRIAPHRESAQGSTEAIVLQRLRASATLTGLGRPMLAFFFAALDLRRPRITAATRALCSESIAIRPILNLT
jgi:hypothetical protein